MFAIWQTMASIQWFTGNEIIDFFPIASECQIDEFNVFFSQIFIAPQNFTDVTFNDNIQLYGRLNDLDLPQLVDDTISVNEPALLQYVIFGKKRKFLFNEC